MVEWTTLKTKKINRVGYDKVEESLHIDFVDRVKSTILVNVPAAVYEFFIEVESPDKFYAELVEGYFEALAEEKIASNNST